MIRDAATTFLTITADRDSVCAGDDTDPHHATFTVPATATVIEMLQAAWRVCPLASIAGGKATWVIEVGMPGRQVGVVAQEWEAPRLVVENGLAEALFADERRSVCFRYLAQRDPGQVFLALTTGSGESAD